MKANNFIIRDAKNMKPAQLREALEAAIGYDAWLNDKRTGKDKPVIYEKFEVKETPAGSIVVKNKED